MREQGGIFLFKKMLFLQIDLAVCHAEARLAQEDILKFKCSWNIFKQNMFVLAGITQVFHSKKYRRGGHGGFWI